jgi:ATP-dependent Lon protease
MTGEITLRGNVLPVGGIKEKVLAARRSGIRTVVMPQANRKNLEEIPRAMRRDMEFVFVRDVRQVFDAGFVEAFAEGATPVHRASSQDVDKQAPESVREPALHTSR